MTASRAHPALWVCVCAFLAYAAFGLIEHYALRTNAFDLSVFDYALWTTASGDRVAYVPMFEHSLFAEHAMPTLLLLAPLSRLFDTPAYLIVLQALFHATAGLLLFLFARRHLDRRLALALLVAFLFSRRSNVAVTRYFYIESAEPMLIFGALLAWSTGRRALYWTLAVLALGCKEDVAIYFLAFGAMVALTGEDRRTGLWTVGLSSVWFATSVFIVIPSFRALYGMTDANPFLEAQYGVLSGGILTPLWRLFSAASIAELVTVTAAMVFLCWLSPRWMAVALPGIAANLAAVPGSGLAGLTGHYLFPILPWLFVAAVFGAQRLTRWAGFRDAQDPSARTRHIARWLPALLLLVTLVDAPLLRTIAGAPWTRLSAAAQVRTQLRTVTLSGTVVAQPNLIPHLARRIRMYGFGFAPHQPDGDFVLLTTLGDAWPLDADGVTREISRLQADVRYEQVTAGPLFTFRRRDK